MSIRFRLAMVFLSAALLAPLAAFASNADLVAAAKAGDAAGVSALIDGGASPNATDDDGDTALMLASGEGHADVAALLVEKGAAVNAADRYGWTALMFAAGKGHGGVVKLLLDSGASADAKDIYGWTALMVAERAEDAEEVVGLLK
ncbi:MAG: ankyrin repeat domain-containing protein [Thermodesulfobacteriota bacterium]